MAMVSKFQWYIDDFLAKTLGLFLAKSETYNTVLVLKIKVGSQCGNLIIFLLLEYYVKSMPLNSNFGELL